MLIVFFILVAQLIINLCQLLFILTFTVIFKCITIYLVVLDIVFTHIIIIEIPTFLSHAIFVYLLDIYLFQRMISRYGGVYRTS